MIPIKDDNPTVNTPYATYALIGLNVLAWVLLQGAGFGEQLNLSVCQYGLIPADLFSQANNLDSSQAYCGSVPGSGWFGIVSSMFMHGSWMHIIGNLWFLWIFGDNVEDSMGPERFVVFYLLCGLCAASAQVFSDTSSLTPMVGASGAIGGVMGAYIVLFPRVKVHMLLILVIIVTTIRVPAIAMLGYWIVVQLIGGFSSMGSTGGGVAFWAHIGGFAGGAALIYVFKDSELLLSHPQQGLGKTKAKDPGSVWDDPDNRQ